MSNTAVMNVLQYSKSKGVQRLVLLALAAHCNEARGDFEAWPSITRLADCANVLRPSASRAMKELIELGEVANTRKINGRNIVYKLVLTVTPCDSQQETTVTPRYAPVTPRYADRNTTLHKQETTRIELEVEDITPSSQGKIQHEEKTQETLSLQIQNPDELPYDYDWKVDAFSIFWENYFTGRKTDRPKAEKVFRKIAKTQDIAKDIIHGVIRHAEIYNRYPKDERKYIPHATTWLNGERWGGDDPAPKSGRDTSNTQLGGSNARGNREPTHGDIIRAFREAGCLDDGTSQRPGIYAGKCADFERELGSQSGTIRNQGNPYSAQQEPYLRLVGTP